METKADIRTQMLKRRADLPLPKQLEKSAEIQKQVLEDPAFIRAKIVYLYMDYRAEVRTGMLLSACLRMGKRTVLPRVDGMEMDFYEIGSIEDVKPGYAGILEPVTQRKVTAGEGYMVVPGAAFSRERYRIGYGKGYYDRYLQRYPDLDTCGLAYDCQIAEHIPAEAHDIALKKIITESFQISADGLECV